MSLRLRFRWSRSKVIARFRGELGAVAKELKQRLAR
jgi:hypothetical protein